MKTQVSLKQSFWHQSVVIGLVLFSFFMSAFISRTVFERLPHLEDEVAYVFQARVFAHGQIVADFVEPVNAYWQPFVISYRETGNRFSKYTPGWSAVLAIGELLGQAWIINAFCSALTVAVVYRLGEEIYDSDVGLIASALVAFSPMALLLNATLMSHTSALFFFSMFMYAYWRITHQRHAMQWGVVAGIMMGLLVINRPLTAIAVAVPFVVWSVLRLGVALYDDVMAQNTGRESVGDGLKPSPTENDNFAESVGANGPFAQITGRPNLSQRRFIQTVSPLVILGFITVIFSLAIPIYNDIATHDPTLNLYTLVWEYDQVGFGTCCGRSSVRGEFDGHSILKGVRHARYDLSLMAADLFGWAVERADNPLGWQLGSVNNRIQQHLQVESDYFPLIGLSWILLPFGLMMGLRKNWMKVWALIGMAWFVVPLVWDMDFLKQSNAQIWAWVMIAGAWMLVLPVVQLFNRKRDAQSIWTWLLAMVALSLIAVHLAYWIGSQRYSTRYYFEALSAIALISALPIAWLVRNYGRLIVYTVFAVVLVYSLYAYSTPRITALYRFNFISMEQIDAVRERALEDAPILVIATDADGTDTTTRWRSYGSLMAVTGPFLDSDIVVARDFLPGGGIREEILARFPDYQVVDIYVNGNDWWFPDEASP